MLRKVDEDEKLKGTALNGTTENFRSGQQVWFLTEHGLYEVLMRSSKPKAKEFRKVVKNILKEIRTQGYYIAGELVEEPTQPTQKAPSTLVEAEHNYINALAQSIIEADSTEQKKEFAERMMTFLNSKH